MKVVFDTNVFVSAFLFPGSQGEQALLFAQRRKVDLSTSVPILTETARVLREKFDQSEKDITAALKIIGRSATIVRPARKITVLEDKPDNRILECAVTVEADLLVTGDHHLLKLKEFEGIPLVRLADFLRSIPSDEGAE
ncbi:PIN domain-containing protein [Nitrospira sp. KM1]|uniref:putative toxin-antitoxin system toxin component, PIN family n=1 Tax=Nitrospira sp. KM1 TaxID=1936990 RepID=UPI0013A741D5|nr:putative toxin-antitoxin system toxin component, PIN family [Nitrospira sp. KM1]BCA56920.1 PIN domain-containing protein [Nitrospira sp. KM1]